MVVISATRSNDTGAKGFLHDWRRLNVAITRAKVNGHMLSCGSWPFGSLCLCPCLPAFLPTSFASSGRTPSPLCLVVVQRSLWIVGDADTLAAAAEHFKADDLGGFGGNKWADLIHDARARQVRASSNRRRQSRSG